VQLQEGNITFVVASAYWTLNCTSPIVISYVENVEPNVNQSLTRSTGGTLWMGMDFPQNQSVGTLYFVSEIWNVSDDHDTTLAFSVCNFSQIFVETTITCKIFYDGSNGTDDSSSCTHNSIRAMPNHPSTQAPINFTDWMTYASADQPSLAERYILNPDPIARDNLDPETGFNLSAVPLADFTQRLAMVINTLWTIGFAPMYISGGLVSNNTYGVLVANATGTNTDPTDGSAYVYAYHPAWLSILFICSGILLLIGIASVFWESQTIGPNVLGFASSIVFHSKYINVPKASSTMSRPEIARMMGDVRVIMQDVKAGDEVGKIAMAKVSKEAQSLKPGRLYR
jgi:hypothetical protein